MSDILIIESIGRPIEADFSKTSVAHARNSVILSQILDADLITGEKDLHLAEGKAYDHIICSYASPYMKYKTLIDVVRNNPDAQLWWFVNDHDLEDNILLRNVLAETNGQRGFNMICNNSREGYRGWILRKKVRNLAGEQIGILDDFIGHWHTLNLNALIYQYERPYSWEEKTGGAVYWGTMRKWRLPDLIEYQGPHLTISATPRTQKKFAENGVSSSPFVDKLSWQRGCEDLAQYKFSLYVEDEHTHENYAHMANRYYEALMFNVVTFFDAKCRANIEKSGFLIDPFFIVNGRAELTRRMAEVSHRLPFESALADNDHNRKRARFEHAHAKQYLKLLFNK